MQDCQKKLLKKYSEIKWYDEEKMSWPKHLMEKLMYHVLVLKCSPAISMRNQMNL